MEECQHCRQLRKELAASREENKDLRRQNEELRGIIAKLLARIDELELKVSRLEGDDDAGSGPPAGPGYHEKVKKKPGKPENSTSHSTQNTNRIPHRALASL
jgi:hypothetical protein